MKNLRLILTCLLFGSGFGITLHAVANEMYYKGGYSEILSYQGEYIGLAIMLAAFILIQFNGKKKEKQKVE